MLDPAFYNSVHLIQYTHRRDRPTEIISFYTVNLVKKTELPKVLFSREVHLFSSIIIIKWKLQQIFWKWQFELILFAQLSFHFDDLIIAMDKGKQIIICLPVIPGILRDKVMNSCIPQIMITKITRSVDKTRMTTSFTKTKFKKSNDQTNIDKS